jgi:hypothetical protein
VQSETASAAMGIVAILFAIWLLLLASLLVPAVCKLHRLLSRSFSRTVHQSLDIVNHVTAQR